ncbi:MAG: DUF2637 domain-containing protein, partial [Pseudonocardia sp.]|nr:DUF2637 domain-containing protein [Pseudonocardia sp.]
LYVLLFVVAAAAAVLSFAALRDLALVCGFSPRLAWLLPVVVDAGAAAGSLVWLGGWSAHSARRFARALALGLLGLSVAANALGHGLAAFALAPAWWVVVVVSAIAPAVLGAVVHLSVLVGRPAAVPPVVDGQDPPNRAEALIAEGAGRRRLSRELDISEYEARQLLARNRPADPLPERSPALNGSGATS